MIKELKQLQELEKKVAKSKGSWPRDKVIEECCEVLMDHQAGEDTVDEEIDLLMCLIDKYYIMHEEKGWFGDLPIQQWVQKTEIKQRMMTEGQSRFIRLLVTTS